MYYSYFANKKIDAQRNYQLAQVTQWQRQDTETFLSTTSQSPSNLIISPSSPSEPKLLRSKSVNFVCQYHLPSFENNSLLPLFPPTNAVSFSVTVNAKQPEIAERRQNDRISKLQFTSPISVQLWKGLFFRKWFQILQNSPPPFCFQS